eukprot:244985_1
MKRKLSPNTETMRIPKPSHQIDRNPEPERTFEELCNDIKEDEYAINELLHHLRFVNPVAIPPLKTISQILYHVQTKQGMVHLAGLKIIRRYLAITIKRTIDIPLRTLVEITTYMKANINLSQSDVYTVSELVKIAGLILFRKTHAIVSRDMDLLRDLIELKKYSCGIYCYLMFTLAARVNKSILIELKMIPILQNIISIWKDKHKVFPSKGPNDIVLSVRAQQALDTLKEWNRVQNVEAEAKTDDNDQGDEEEDIAMERKRSDKEEQEDDSSDSDETCMICLYLIDENRIATNCAHYYHSQCLSVWLKVKKFCPICRCRVTQTRTGVGHMERIEVDQEECSICHCSGYVDKDSDMPRLHVAQKAIYCDECDPPSDIEDDEVYIPE